MDMKKFEKLMDLVINENNEQAKELFHEIVVEKSREIFESIMAEEMDEMGGQVGDLMDEIDADETGLSEEEIEFDDEIEMGDGEGDDLDFGDEVSMDSSELDDMSGGDEVEDAVIRIEDKLDQLMAEFEAIMGDDAMGDDDLGDEGDFGDDDMDAEDDYSDFGDDDMDAEDEDAVMEAVQLQKVSVTHGDDGVQKKSPVAANSGKAGMDSNPVKFSGYNETMPAGPKGPGNVYAKGEKEVPGAGKFKNAPGHKGLDLETAPKAKHGDDGSNTKSPVAESRRMVRRRIK